MNVMDIGGGFPSGDLSEPIINALKSTRNDPLGYKMIAEPGRHFSNTCCHLGLRIIGKREKRGKLCYHVNDSLYHMMNCVSMDGFSMES